MPNYGLNPGPVPRFAYFGSGEIFAGPLGEELSDSPVESYEGPWEGHAETMVDAPGVVAVVQAFWASLTDG